MQTGLHPAPCTGGFGSAEAAAPAGLARRALISCEGRPEAAGRVGRIGRKGGLRLQKNSMPYLDPPERHRGCPGQDQGQSNFLYNLSEFSDRTWWVGKEEPASPRVAKPLNLSKNRTFALELCAICKCHKAPLPSKQAKPISTEEDSTGGT